MRRGAVLLAGLVLAGVIVGTLAVSSSGGETDHAKPAPERVRDIRRLDTPMIVVAASGTDEAVCRALINSFATDGGGWNPNVLAGGADGLGGTWLFCEGETSSGIGAIAARSPDGIGWTARQLGISQRNHAGDEVQVDIRFSGASICDP
jgi:hypothetical protein